MLREPALLRLYNNGWPWGCAALLSVTFGKVIVGCPDWPDSISLFSVMLSYFCGPRNLSKVLIIEPTPTILIGNWFNGCWWYYVCRCCLPATTNFSTVESRTAGEHFTSAKKQLAKEAIVSCQVLYWSFKKLFQRAFLHIHSS